MQFQDYDRIAGIYNNYRPDYPYELLNQYYQSCDLHDTGGIILDVGAGTGISTRLLRALFPAQVAIIGIEPGDDMRQTAVSNTQHLPNLAFLKAPAEALPFDRAMVDAVFAAQALHWFKRPNFYAEAARVLRSRGVLGIIQNNRRWQDNPFLEEYESILEEYGDGYGRYYRSFDLQAELKSSGVFSNVRRLTARHELLLPQADFMAWSFSSTKMQACVRNVGEEAMRRLLQALLEKHFAGQETVSILYETELYLATCKG